MKKTVLITGASSGIGRATAVYFQENGWNVIASMRKPENEEELSKLENVMLSRLDVLDLESINQTVEEGIKRFGKIDVLVNNAGYGTFGAIETFPRENILRQFNTNVIGLIDVMRAVLPHMRENKDGVIINISSVGGRMTFPLFSLYHGTKFAVEGITESMTFELEAFGVKAKIVEPGAIATDFAGRSIDFKNDESVAEYQELVGKLMAGFAESANTASPASLVAEVIYGAATDGTNQIRYTAGEDAKVLMANRSQFDDETFMKGVKERFKL